MRKQCCFKSESEQTPICLGSARTEYGFKIKNKTQLKQLFKTSDAVTDKCHRQIHDFNSTETEAALFAFRGEVFKALAPEDFTGKELAFANAHMHILSGLYGILKALDGIKIYRFDFNTPLKLTDSSSLKKFWQDKIITYFKQLLVEQETILNLASAEYSYVLTSSHLKNRLITLGFREKKQGKFTNTSVFSKQARGFFCREVIKKRISNPQELKECTVAGYSFQKNLSNENVWFFVR